jgi:hypothetical protein
MLCFFGGIVSRLMPSLRVAADVAARKNVIATTAFGDELRSARHPGRSPREPGGRTFFARLGGSAENNFSRVPFI